MQILIIMIIIIIRIAIYGLRYASEVIKSKCETFVRCTDWLQPTCDRPIGGQDCKVEGGACDAERGSEQDLSAERRSH